MAIFGSASAGGSISNSWMLPKMWGAGKSVPEVQATYAKPDVGSEPPPESYTALAAIDAEIARVLQILQGYSILMQGTGGGMISATERQVVAKHKARLAALQARRGELLATSTPDTTAVEQPPKPTPTPTPVPAKPVVSEDPSNYWKPGAAPTATSTVSASRSTAESEPAAPVAATVAVAQENAAAATGKPEESGLNWVAILGGAGAGLLVAGPLGAGVGGVAGGFLSRKKPATPATTPTVGDAGIDPLSTIGVSYAPSDLVSGSGASGMDIWKSITGGISALATGAASIIGAINAPNQVVVSGGGTAYSQAQIQQLAAQQAAQTQAAKDAQLAALLAQQRSAAPTNPMILPIAVIGGALVLVLALRK